MFRASLLPVLLLLTACADGGGSAGQALSPEAYLADDALAARTLAACRFTNAAERRVVMKRPECVAVIEAEGVRAAAEWDAGMAAVSNDMRELIETRRRERETRRGGAE